MLTKHDPNLITIELLEKRKIQTYSYLEELAFLMLLAYTRYSLGNFPPGLAVVMAEGRARRGGGMAEEVHIYR